MSMTAQVNAMACIRCGLCAALCPEVFSLNEPTPAQAITEEITAQEQQRDALKAAQSCPTGAIRVQE